MVHFGLRLLLYQCIELHVTHVTSALRHGAVLGLTAKVASTTLCVCFCRRNKKKKDGDESNSSKGHTSDGEPGIGGPLCEENGLDADIAYCDIICIHVKELTSKKKYFKRICGESLRTSWYYMVTVSCRHN